MRLRFLIGISFLFATPSSAQVIEDLSCVGLGSQFLKDANGVIKKFEDKILDPIQDVVVQFTNFDKGNEKFRIQGGLNFSKVSIPKFDCKNSKKFFKSGAPDVNIFPEYPVDVTVFGKKVNLLTVSVSLAGDARNKNTESTDSTTGSSTADATGTDASQAEGEQDGLDLMVKSFGVNLISIGKRGAKIEAALKNVKSATGSGGSGTTGTSASNSSGGSTTGGSTTGGQTSNSQQSKTAEATGNTQNILDINKSLEDIKQNVIIPLGLPGLNLYVNAGFVFSVKLNYFYRLDAGLFKMGKTKNITRKNKASIPSELCVADKGGGDQVSECQSKPNKKAGMSDDFMSRFASSIQNTVEGAIDPHLENLKAIQESALALKSAILQQDSKLIQEQYGHISASLEYAPESYKKLVMANLDLKRSMRGSTEEAEGDSGFDFSNYTRDDYKKMLVSALNLYSSVKAEIDALRSTAQKLKNFGKMLGDFPAVEVSGGAGADVRASAWVRVTLEYNVLIAKLYAGVVGQFDPLDSRVTIAMKYKTNSPYVNFTLNTWMISMKGQLSAIYGVDILGNNVFSGNYVLASFPGWGIKDEKLLARIKLKPFSFFWCTSLPWANNTIDSEKCADGDVATEEVDAELANSLRFRETVLGEHVPNPQDTCFLRNGEGEVVFSTSDSAVCSAMLPDANSSLDQVAGADHPLVRVSVEKPETFFSSLRDSQNRPYLKLNRITESAEDWVTYKSDQAVTYSLTQEEDPATQALPLPPSFLPQPPGPGDLQVPSVKKRILTPTAYGATVQGADGNVIALSASNIAVRSNSQFKIKLDSNKRLVVTDLPALSNSELIHLAQTFRTGLCQVRGSGLDRALFVNGNIFPEEGDQRGRVHENRLNFSEYGCAGAETDDDYLACMLREKIISNECFPPERIASLIAIGNMSDAEVMASFFGTPRRILGSVIAGEAHGDGNYVSTEPQSIIGGTVNSQNYSSFSQINEMILNGRDQIDSIFQPPYQGCGAQFEPVPYMCSFEILNALWWYDFGLNPECNWYFDQLAHFWIVKRNGNLIGPQQLGYKFYSHGRIMSFAIRGDDPTSVVYPPSYPPVEGNSADSLVPFENLAPGLKATYSNPITSTANGALCNANDPGHITKVFESGIASLSSNPSYSGATAQQLANAIRNCTVHGHCTIFPESQDDIQNTCSAKFSLAINGGNGGIGEVPLVFGEIKDPSSIQDCKMRAAGFSDSKTVCNSYQDLLRTNAVSILNSPNTTNAQVKVDVKIKFDAVTRNAGSNAIVDITSTEQRVAECRFTLEQSPSLAGGSEIKDLRGVAVGEADAKPGVCQLLVESGEPQFAMNSSPVVQSQGAMVSSGYDLEPLSQSGPLMLQSIVPSKDHPIDDFDQCKAALGFGGGWKKIFDLNFAIFQTRTAEACDSLDGAQALELRSRFPLAGNASYQNLKLIARLKRPDGTIYSQNVGDCGNSKTTLGKKISELPCSLRVVRAHDTNSSYISHDPSVAGKSFADLPVDLPGISVSESDPGFNAEAIAQYDHRQENCRLAIKNRFFSTTNPVVSFLNNRPSLETETGSGAAETCSDRLRQRSEINDLGGGAAFTTYPVLGSKKAGAVYACGGPYQAPSALLSEGANSNCQIKLSGVSGMLPLLSGQTFPKVLSSNTSFPLSSTLTAEACHSSVQNSYSELGFLENPSALCLSIEGKVANMLLSLYGNGTPSGGSVLSAAQFNGHGGQIWALDPSGGDQNVLSVEVRSSFSTEAASVAPLATCQFQFKEVNRRVVWLNQQPQIQRTFQIHPSTFSAPVGADVADGLAAAATSKTICYTSNVRDTQTGVVSPSGSCLSPSGTDRMVLGGADYNLVGTITDPAFNVDDADSYYENLCATRLPDLEPVPESIQPDVKKRYPLYVVNALAQKPSLDPNAQNQPKYYCKAPSCELRAGFGYQFVVADSSWKAKNTVVPRTFNECVSYYAGKYQEYCSRIEYLRQLPRNMPIEMAASFENLTVHLGTCAASSKSESVCRIVAQNLSSRTTGTGYQTFKEYNLNASPVVVGADSIAPSFLVKRTNSLEECQAIGSRLDRAEDLCTRVKSGNPVNVGIQHEIAARLGDMSLPIRYCLDLSKPAVIQSNDQSKPAGVTVTLGESSVDGTVSKPSSSDPQIAPVSSLKPLQDTLSAKDPVDANDPIADFKLALEEAKTQTDLDLLESKVIVFQKSDPSRDAEAGEIIYAIKFKREELSKLQDPAVTKQAPETIKFEATQETIK